MPIITACHVLTAFGDLRHTWTGLLAGHCLRDSARVEMAGGGHGYSRVAELALAVGRGVLTAVRPPTEGTALVLATSRGEIDRWLTGDSSNNGLAPAGIANLAAGVAAQLGLAGPVLTVSAACAGGVVGLIRACLLLRSGEAQRVLVVAAESSFHPLLLASYQRLGVLAPAGYGCRPFDRRRRGFFVAEAAAAVMLESRGEGVQTFGMALGSEAASITAPDPSPERLQRLILRAAGGRGVELVHAHATGTELNDPIELAAIDAAAGDLGCRPAVYSHKGALGHSLGASGLLAVVLNCMAHQHSVIPPNAATTEPLPSQHAVVSASSIAGPVRRSLVIASGFGGPAAVVGLESAL
jgi:3-oxoacyl-[acyl-carrier-protein] synthase II